MARKCVEVKTLHGYTIENLNEIEKKLKSDYSKSLMRAVIMRHQGIHTSVVAKTIGKSVPSVTIYINRWNESGINAVADLRGGSVSTFTNEMLNDLKDTVINKNPRELGFTAATWNTHMLKEYIAEKYGLEYSSEWIRQLLIRLGFSYKRGLYQPTKVDPELQALFKKNSRPLGYC